MQLVAVVAGLALNRSAALATRNQNIHKHWPFWKGDMPGFKEAEVSHLLSTCPVSS